MEVLYSVFVRISSIGRLNANRFCATKVEVGLNVELAQFLKSSSLNLWLIVLIRALRWVLKRESAENIKVFP